MRQDARSHSPLNADDNWPDSLPRCRLIHTFHLVSDADSDGATRAATWLKHEHTVLGNAAMVRRGGVLEQRVVLGGISEGEARALRDQLAKRSADVRIRVEHQVIRC